MATNWKWLTPPDVSFAGLPVCTDLNDLDAEIAIIGLHFKSPYLHSPADRTIEVEETAPDAIRRQSSIYSDHLHHYDFDFDDTLLADQDIRIVDCGDIDKQAKGDGAVPENITAAIRTLLDKGIFPIGIGTDEGSIIPVIRAYDGYKKLCVVHIDAHIDWRDERDGVREGYSSVMRRASEMPWVEAMAQIGLRGIGSARREEVDAALSFGSVFIRAREVHKEGITACLDRIPAADHYLVTIDADAFDTAIAPGVLFPSPGGLRFDEATDLFYGIALKGAIVGLNIFEVRPERDINDLTATTFAQLIIHFFGILAHTGQIR